MDIELILQKLRAAFNGERYTINRQVFDSDPLNKLLTECFGGTLVIRSTREPARTGNRARIEGTLADPLLNLAGLAVTADFYAGPNGSVHLAFATGVAGENPTIGRLFPKLADWNAADFKLEEVKLRLDTELNGDIPYLPSLERNAALQAKYGRGYKPQTWDPQLARVVLVEGKLGFPEGWQWLKDILPTETQSVRAVVEVLRGVPRTCINLSYPGLVTIGHLNMTPQVDLIALLDAARIDGEEYVGSRRLQRLGLVLQYNDLRLPTYIILPSDDGKYLEAEMDTTEVSRRALDTFKGLLHDSIGQYIPAGFPSVGDVLLKRLGVTFSVSPLQLGTVTAGFGLAEGSKMVLIPDLLEVSGLDVEFSMAPSGGAIPYLAASAKGAVSLKNAAITGTFVGELSLPGLEFSVGLGPGSSVNLTQLVQQLVPVPIGLPEIVCYELNLNGSYAEKRVSFSAGFGSETGLTLGFISLRDLLLEFTYSNGSTVDGSIRLTSSFAIGDKATMLLMAEAYRSGDTKGWRFKGALDTLPDNPIRILDILPEAIRPDPDLVDFNVQHIGLTYDTGDQSLVFTLKTPDTFIHFHGIGKVSSRDVTITVKKTTKGYDWKVSTGGRIELLEYEKEDGTTAAFLVLDGTLEIAGGEKPGITFKSSKEDSGIRDIPFLLPAGQNPQTGALIWSSLNIGVREVGFVKKEGKWTFFVDNKLTFNRLPKFLSTFVPKDGIEILLTIDSGGADIQLKNGLVDFTVPSVNLPAFGDIPAFELGASRIWIGNLTLKLRRKFGVEAEVRYYLPQRLNHIFGTLPDGRPRLGEVFATFNPQKPDESKYLGLAVKAGMGDKDPYVGIGLTQLPLNLLEDAGNQWAIHFGPKEADNMGRYGCIKIDKGSFDFLPSQGAFQISGGIEIAKDPALPLDLLKEFLKQRGQEDLAKALPPLIRIPLRKPISFKDEHGNLVPQKIGDFLGIKLDDYPVIKSALETIAEKFNLLPEDFRAYLEPPTIEKISWYFKMTADGGMEGNIEVSPPIRLLMIGPPSPAFMGVTLKKFAFGQILGGQALKVRMHAEFDMFDLLTLASSLLITDDRWKDYFGNPAKFSRKILIHDLLVLIFYQAGVPIPVPIFFDLLGIRYYGPGNFSLGLEAKFPEPKFDLRKLGEILMELVKFFRNPTYALPEKPMTPFDLQLTLGPAFVKGGKRGSEITIGRETPLPLPSVFELMAKLLNAVKFFDLDRTVTTIPVDYRFLQVTDLPVIACLRVSGTWLLCTPTEFTGGLYSRMEIPEARMRLLMDILPPRENGTRFGDKDKGVLMFINGKWDTSYSSFESGVALAAVSGKRFGLAVKLDGYVANLFWVNARASLVVAPPTKPFVLEGAGQTHLSILGINVFDGETSTTITTDAFSLKGDFHLFNDWSPLYIGTPEPIGGTLSQNDLTIKGGIKARILLFSGSGDIDISNAGISYNVNILGLRSGFTFKQENGALIIGGTIPLGLISFGATITVNPAAQRIHFFLTSNTFLDLFSSEIEFWAGFNQGFEGLGGEFRLYVLRTINNNPVFKGNATLHGDALSLSGGFQLLPDGSPINLKGGLGGEFRGDYFRLTGSLDAKAGEATILSFQTVLTPQEFTLKAEDLVFWYQGTVAVRGGKLLIIGRAWNSISDLRFYINDEFPFLHFGDPPGMLELPTGVPESDWVRLAAFAVQAEHRRMLAEKGIGKGAPRTEDEKEMDALYKWELLKPSDGAVRLKLTDRGKAQGIFAELATQASDMVRAVPDFQGASLTLSVKAKGKSPYVKAELALKAKKGVPAKKASVKVAPGQVDTLMMRLLETLLK